MHNEEAMKNNDGKDLEKIIGQIEKAMKPFGAIVRVDHKIKTKYGTRQFDVTVTFEINGVPTVILIEAKDYGRKPEIEKVEGFIQRCRLVNNSQGIMISKMGFSKPAIRQAKDYGVTLKRIATTDEINWAREIKLPFHIEEFTVKGLTAFITGPDSSTLPKQITISDGMSLRINERIKLMLDQKHDISVYKNQYFKESKGLFAIVNGPLQIDLEVNYKFIVERTVYYGMKPAVGVLGYENLNEGQYELIKWGQRIDKNIYKCLIDKGDIELSTIGSKYGMGLIYVKYKDFTPKLVVKN